MNITSSTSPTLEGISRCRHLAVHSKGAKTNQNVKSIKLILKKLSLYIILLQLFQRKHTTYLLYSLQSCNTLLNLYMTFPEIFQSFQHCIIYKYSLKDRVYLEVIVTL